MNNAIFSNQKILVFGLGVLGGGVNVVKTLIELGAEIRITDLKTELELQDSLAQFDSAKIDQLTLGAHDRADIDWADIIIKNPAVPTSSEFIQYAFEQNKHVTTEAALYLKLTQTKTIGITGTRGKTTTTTMVYEVLRQNLSQPVLVGGNIQDKGCLSLLLEETSDTISVIELSSWALEGCHWEKVSPNISVITNLYPDHLNRYDERMENYAHDKAAIFKYQKSEDTIYLNRQNEWFEFFAKQVQSNLVEVNIDQLPDDIQLKIPGQHNRQNAMFAYLIGKQFSLSHEQIKTSLENFSGVEYRQQVVGEKDGLQFINDSTSTTPVSLITALNTFPEATFIIGGTSKHLPLQALAQTLALHRGKVVFLKGSGSEELVAELKKNNFTKNTELHATLASAFTQATAITLNGHIVFSPGFTSFELFKNEFDRAEQFNQLVNSFLTTSTPLQ